MRVVWFDNLQTDLTDKNPVLIFLDTNSKKSVLLEGTLMTWFHSSNLNPSWPSDSSLRRKEVCWTCGDSIWDHPFDLSSFISSWTCFNICLSNSYWYSVGRPSFSPCPLISPSYIWMLYFIPSRPWWSLSVLVDLRCWWVKKRVYMIIWLHLYYTKNLSFTKILLSFPFSNKCTCYFNKGL